MCDEDNGEQAQVVSGDAIMSRRTGDTVSGKFIAGARHPEELADSRQDYLERYTAARGLKSPQIEVDNRALLCILTQTQND